jgi:hypothetical protein
MKDDLAKHLILGHLDPTGHLRKVRDKRYAEIEQAPFDQVDSILDLLDNPGELAGQFEPMNLQLAFADILTRWGKRDPERMRERVVARIHRPRSRQVLFLVLQELTLRDRAEILRPVVEHVEEMSEDEQVDLASALWTSHEPGSRRLLEEMARRVPVHHSRAHEEVRDALAWLEAQREQ